MNLFVKHQNATNAYIEYCQANDVVFGEQMDFGLFETEFLGEPKYGDKKHKYFRGKNNIGNSQLNKPALKAGKEIS